MIPSYLNLHIQDTIKKARDILFGSLKSCNLCSRNCGVNRLNGDVGFCKINRLAKVDSAFLHFGEEPELVGNGGSGTIFFSHCNLGCIYCQNYNLSHLGEGSEVSAQELAEMMLSLQSQGAENINFVTPTHVIVQILEALIIAIEKGLHLPLVYNCGGYENLNVINLASGVFDIYMPDIKYSDNTVALKYSGVSDYWQVAQEAVKEMHRQVGDLLIEKNVAKKGLLVRHLILPNRLAGSFKVLDFIKELSAHTYVNIMDQYRPCHMAYKFNELLRRITQKEYLEVVNYAKEIGLHRGFG